MSFDGVSRQFELPGDISAVLLERVLWTFVVLALIADIVTTFVGLQLGLTESNPIARTAIEGYGVVGMLVLKGVAIGIGLLCRPVLPASYRPIVPAGLAIPWMIAVSINIYLISAAI